MPQLPGALRHLYQEAVLHQLPSLRETGYPHLLRAQTLPFSAVLPSNLRFTISDLLSVQLRGWHLPCEAAFTVEQHRAGAHSTHLTNSITAPSPSFPWIKTLRNDLVSPSLAMNASSLTVPPNGEFDPVSAHLAQPTHSDSSVLLLRRFFNLRMTDPGIPQGGGGGAAVIRPVRSISLHMRHVLLPPCRPQSWWASWEPSSFIPAFSVCTIYCVTYILYFVCGRPC